MRLRTVVVVAGVVTALAASLAFAAGVHIGLGPVQTTGVPPLIHKSATLTIVNLDDVSLTNATAKLQPSDLFTIVRGVIPLPAAAAGQSVQSTTTFDIELDTTKRGSRNVGMRWVLEFDQGGEHRSVELVTVLDVPELD